jgi:hypothetical protein
MVGEDYKVSGQYTFRVPMRDVGNPNVLQSGKSPSVIIYKPDGTREASPPSLSELETSGVYGFAYTFPAVAGAYTFLVSATTCVPVPWTVQVRSNSRTDLAAAATALSNTTWTDAKAAYIDAAVSGRAAPGDILAAPANKLATDASGRVTVGANADKVGYGLAADQSAATVGTVNALGTQAKADVKAQADASITGYAPAKPADILVNPASDKIDGSLLDAAVSSRSILAAPDVWANATRTITGGSVTSVGDKTGYGLAADQSGVTVGAVNALGAQAKTDVRGQVDAGLQGVNLDRVVHVSAGAAKPTVGSYLDQVMNSSGAQGFDPATDSLEALADTGGGGPSVGEIADAVWDEGLAGHAGVGSTGEAQGRLDATVSSRSTLTAQQVWEYANRALTGFGSLVGDIWGYVARTVTGGSIGSVSALGTQAKADVKAEADAALAAYDGATGVDLATAVAPLATAAALSAHDGKLDAVKTKTDNLPAQPAARGDAMALTAGERSAVADAVLDEPVQSATPTADSLRAAAKAAWAQGFGKWVLSGTVLRLYGPDGTSVVRQFNIDSAEAPTERVPA